MISKKEIKKIAKKVLRRQRGLRDHQIIHPQREWSLAMLVGFVLLIASSAWSTVTYNEVSQLEVQNDNAGEIKQTVYRSELILSSLDEFRTRQVLYNELLAESEAARAEEIVAAEESLENVETDEVSSEGATENEEQSADSEIEVVEDENVELDIN